MNTSLPLVSIIMPTLNSSNTIELSLKSIKVQNYPKNKIEILVIDGGSTDNTTMIAKRFGSKILHNPRVQQEYAKHIGLIKAKGKYACFLDSDEVLKNKNSIKNKVIALEENNECNFAVFSGYIKPKNASSINTYINLFSDPFANYMYGISTDYRFYIAQISKKYHIQKNKLNFKIIQIKNNKIYPLIDLCAGNLINLEYLKKILGNKISNSMIIPNLFEKLTRSNNKFILMKNDPIVHYSTDSFKKYIKKLHWRIVANTHYKNIPGTGYINRESGQNSYFKIKKYIFIVYSITIIGPIFDSVKKFIKSGNIVSFIHPFISLMVSIDIIIQRLFLIFGVKSKLMAYGKQNIKLNIPS